MNPPIKWHFSVPGPKHLPVALDNRTRRSFVSRNGPPGNVAGSLDRTEHGADEQIPAGPFTDGKRGAGRHRASAGARAAAPRRVRRPAAFRAFDIKDYNKKLAAGSPIRHAAHDRHRSRMRSRPGPSIRCAGSAVETPRAQKQVLLLSGDVHYSSATELSYWTKGNNVPSRIVQFTGSGFKNVMPWFIGSVDRVLSFAQRMSARTSVPSAWAGTSR